MEAAEASLPRLNEPAPDFQATSTQGPVKLSDYRGKWVVLFSHPADFTPVCTTELSEFARRAPEFEKLGVQLIGLSIDSIYSHIAWIRNMEQHFGVKVKYPRMLKAMIYYPLTTAGAWTKFCASCRACRRARNKGGH